MSAPDLDLLRRVDEAVDRGDPATALALLDRISARDASLPLRLRLTDVLLALRRLDDAERELEEAGRRLTNDDERCLYRQYWGLLERERGRYSEAAVHFRECVSLRPERTDGRIVLGSCFARMGRLEDAADAHRAATRCDGDPDEAWANLGLVLRAMGDLRGAKEAFENALRIDPRYGTARDGLRDVVVALALVADP